MHSRGPEFNSLNCSCNQFLCFFNYEGPKKFFLLVGRKFSGPALITMVLSRKNQIAPTLLFVAVIKKETWLFLSFGSGSYDVIPKHDFDSFFWVRLWTKVFIHLLIILWSHHGQWIAMSLLINKWSK